MDIDFSIDWIPPDTFIFEDEFGEEYFCHPFPHYTNIEDYPYINKAITDHDLLAIQAFVAKDIPLDWSYHGYCPINWAVRCDERDIMHCLVNAGVDVNIDDADSMFTIHFSQSAEAVHFLVARGAEVHRTLGNPGETPLYTAAYMGIHDVVQALIECGADINQRMSNRMTALMGAEEAIEIEIVETLKSYGAKDHFSSDDEDE